MQKWSVRSFTHGKLSYKLLYPYLCSRKKPIDGHQIKSPGAFYIVNILETLHGELSVCTGTPGAKTNSPGVRTNR